MNNNYNFAIVGFAFKVIIFSFILGIVVFIGGSGGIIGFGIAMAIYSLLGHLQNTWDFFLCIFGMGILMWSLKTIFIFRRVPNYRRLWYIV